MRNSGSHNLSFEPKIGGSQAMNIKKLAGALAVAMLIGPTAFAQSSGNFSASGSSAACAIGAGGVLSGGIVASQFTANISTSNCSRATFDITPSPLTSLLTYATI